MKLPIISSATFLPSFPWIKIISAHVPLLPCTGKKNVFVTVIHIFLFCLKIKHRNPFATPSHPSDVRPDYELLELVLAQDVEGQKHVDFYKAMKITYVSCSMSSRFPFRFIHA